MAIHFSQALLPDGWARDVRIGHADGLIATIQIDVPPAAGDERCGIGLPGLPNLHSHAFQRGMAGLCEQRGPAADDFWTWRTVMYRFLEQMTPDDVEAIAALAYMEMLEAGFTRVGEFHYLHHDPNGRPYADPAELAGRIAAAAQTTGINLTLLPCFYAHGDFGGAPPLPGQRRFLSDLDEFATLLARAQTIVATLPGGTLGVAPHSLRAVTGNELDAILATAPTGPVHMHIAEQLREVSACQAVHGMRPVEWLLAHQPVDARWCLIHATHMTSAETAALAATGAVAGLCPITEANLGDGIFDGAGWLAGGGRYGVGTDSNILIDAAGELRGLEYAQRLGRRGRNLMATQEGAATGGTLFRTALHGGAAALGVSAGLQPGAPADILELDPTAPSLLHRHGDALLDSFVFAGHPALIRTVRVRGQVRTRDGRHIHRAAISTAYEACLSRLLSA